MSNTGPGERSWQVHRAASADINMTVVAYVHYTSDFRRAYRKLPRNIQDAVDKKDKLFRSNPYHSGLNTHKLHKPLEGLWSFWVTRNYRILFEFIEDGAIFYDVGTHDIYR